MKKKKYIFPVVSVNYLDTEKLMMVSSPSEPPSSPGSAHASQQKAF